MSSPDRAMVSLEAAMRVKEQGGPWPGAFVLLVLTACGGGSPGAPGESGEPGHDAASFSLAVIGSSTAAGEGASRPDHAWVMQLGNTLADETRFRVRNLAVDGYTTTDLLPGSGSSGNIDEAIDEQPDLILVALAGSNDIAAGTSSSEFVSRLLRLRDRAEAAGIPTFFVSTAPKDLSDAERRRLAEWAATMGQRFQECWVPASAAYSPCFVDVFALLADPDLDLAAMFDSGDGIHLNDAGHAVVFRAAEPVVQQYVCSVRACQ